ncbi:uncharacterized protein LOC134289406 [Aedes albopictus]|uniref:THAP-type domain-containing protein n=1 Tax=Aedes albopictus TaxID=7160 RepID=A0ABM1Y7U3_AEDAL
MGRKTCCVPGCFSTSTAGRKSFFQIVETHRDTAAWKRFCNVANLPESSVICEDHFAIEDFINASNKSQGLRRNAVPCLRGVCLADVTENDSMDFESNCYAQENDSFSETGDAMEVAAELEIESSCSPDLRQETVSTDKVYLAHTGIKAKSLPEDEKLVSIFFDEMAITDRISYFGNAQPDYFTGFKTRLPGAN